MTTTRPSSANAWADNPDREGGPMTSDTQAPGPDAPDSTAKAPAPALLNGAPLPVTTAGTAATGPKSPPVHGHSHPPARPPPRRSSEAIPTAPASTPPSPTSSSRPPRSPVDLHPADHRDQRFPGSPGQGDAHRPVANRAGWPAGSARPIYVPLSSAPSDISR